MYIQHLDTSIDTMSIGFNVQYVNSKSSTCSKSKSLNSGTSDEYSNFGWCADSRQYGNFGDSGEFSYLGDYGITCDSGESDELLEFLIPGGSGESGVSGKLGDSDFSDIVDTAEWWFCWDWWFLWIWWLWQICWFWLF